MTALPSFPDGSTWGASFVVFRVPVFVRSDFWHGFTLVVRYIITTQLRVKSRAVPWMFPLLRLRFTCTGRCSKSLRCRFGLNTKMTGHIKSTVLDPRALSARIMSFQLRLFSFSPCSRVVSRQREMLECSKRYVAATPVCEGRTNTFVCRCH